jgi:hypothetical protein
MDCGSNSLFKREVEGTVQPFLGFPPHHKVRSSSKTLSKFAALEPEHENAHPGFLPAGRYSTTKPIPKTCA